MGLFSAIGSIAGGVLGYASQERTNDLNYRMFKEQLEYDKPVNQVARLKEAGLNPNLVYGSGIQNMQTAGKQPKMENPMDKAAEGLNLGLLSANLRKAKAEAKQAEAGAALSGTQAVMAKLSAPYSLARMQEDIVRTMLSNERFGYDNALLFKGMTPSFDRGVASQTIRALGQVWDWTRKNLKGGVNMTSRPSRGFVHEPTPAFGNYEGISKMSPEAFTPAGSWAYGSSYF